ncbi:MAG: UDP-glucose 4-epimerase GalE [Clostridiales bacterium]|nr:UDP-glucose 4-epimerase GalE [Clostridiales bacterium]
MSVLVTGGAGYIGSHTCVELINAGVDVVIVDNFCNCKKSSINRIRALVNKDFTYYECDIRDKKGLDSIFKKEKIDSVIHFAGLKAVDESVYKPLEYFDNNVNGTLVLLDVMRNNGCKKIVFSSSATVYGMNNISPLTEDMQVGGVTNPYGRTKFMIECILQDLYVSDNSWSICLLRYFNPIGAHKSGTMGEDPNGIPNNLMPYITQVAIGKREYLNVWGDDYDTPDGTGVRDYIHVVDLALGHVKAVQKIEAGSGLYIYNLGTGKGYSVLDVVKAFEKASGVKIPYKIGPRRAGDIATCYSDPGKAYRELGWKAERDIEEMCEDSWRWQSQNPNGYPD